MLWQSIRMLLPVCRRCGSPQAARFSCLTSQTENRLSTDPNPSDAGENTDNAVSMAHVPVMVNEVLQLVKPREGQVILDMTFGGGGHSLALIQEEPGVRIYALDRDPVAHDTAVNLCRKHPQLVPLQGRFSQLPQVLQPHGQAENSIDAVLFDVGASSMQFDEISRGFSLSRDGPLDMRMDGNRSPDAPTAADVVNYLDASGLYKILKRYGEEKRSKHISQAIVDHRNAFGPIRTTRQLADIVSGVFQDGVFHRDKLSRHSHVATRTFQALRIFVNNELNELYNGLEISHRLLRPGGICIAITFHSLEDRIVKRQFHGIDMDEKLNMSVGDWARRGRGSAASGAHLWDTVSGLLVDKWKPWSRKVTEPSEQEVMTNPRSRSAKLRAAYKL